MTVQILPILLPGILVLILGAVVLWAMARRYRRELGLRKAPQEQGQDVSFIINAFQDVTRTLKEKEKELERLKALAELRAETVESYTQNILQCVTSGVITFDGAGTVTTANRAAEEILGCAGQEVVGKTCADIFGDGDVCRLIRETLVNELPSRRMETGLSRNGERMWLGFNTAILSNARGECLGVILSFSDLTEVKRLQEQIELKERLMALGEMSAGIAHELRNPMAVISGYMKLLAKKLDEQGQAVVRDVTAEIDGMNRIIGDLLTFARPTSLNRVSVRVNEMIETCLATALQAQGEAAGVKTVLDLDAVETPVDEGLMRQAFGNLLQNAIEAMPDGGTLTVRLRGNRDLAVMIRDTGVGIPPDKVKKIFLPFFTTKDKGVGMGLALAHKIVTSHGGRIEVESEEGKGTTFTVTLPLG